MAGKRARYQENTGMPASMARQLASSSAQDADDKRYHKKTKRGPSRKEERKQARDAKKQRKNTAHHRMRGFAPQPASAAPAAKPAAKRQAERSPAVKKGNKAAAGSSAADERARLTRFAQRNEGMYRLLRERNLVEDVDREAGVKSSGDADEELEDREMRRLERNLGIKSNGKLASAFFDEGLGELFDGYEYGSSSVRGKGEATSDSKAEVKAETKAQAESESEDEEEADDSAMDVDLAGDSDDDSDDDMFGLSALEAGGESGSESEDSDIAEMYRSQGIDASPEVAALSGSDSEADSDGSSEAESEAEIDSDDDSGGAADRKAPDDKPAVAAPAAGVGKYIPPRLRQQLQQQQQAQAQAQQGSEAGDAEQMAAIRRTLQGQLNRLSESNMDGIVGQIEQQYQRHARHHVTSVLSDLVLQAIRSRIHMLDSFLVVNAALVGAVYRAIGVEPVAHLVQKLVEEFDQRFAQGKAEAQAAAAKEAEEDDEEADGVTAGKECQNLCVFLAELYNFHVVSCQLVYDVVRLCAADVGEFTAELLLGVIRVAGVQLRRDDPQALREIVHQVGEAVGRSGGESALSSRCRFMVDSLARLRDNRMRQTMAQSAGDVARLKKFLGNMDKRRVVAGAAEPMHVRLEDIRQAGTRGRWWLVGASWVGNQHEGAQHNSAVAEWRDQQQQQQQKQRRGQADEGAEKLLQLARQQHMNTDVRRSVFVVLQGSSDYAEAFDRLLRLDLKRTQTHDVVRVLVHCCGQEAVFNPYYALVGLRLCAHHASYRLTLQYALWDFLRELGEADVGGMSHTPVDLSEMPEVPLRRVVNVAKLYAWLVGKLGLSLLVLKTLTFARVGRQARVFLQVMFTTLFGLFRGMEEKDAEALAEVLRRAAQNPTMCQGLMLFLRLFVRDCDLVPEEDRKVMRWACRVAKQVFRSAVPSASDDF
ncbi:suppressor of glycerol defect [Coemansia erecta]|uniref:Suppressor of glycerol defect n=1 Tax=Coemansia erecta TaxID=147472 RepID=A0A9W7XQX2_9FUNG|nr:suppressor of glycerol defect [Coemansia erecta]